MLWVLREETFSYASNESVNDKQTVKKTWPVGFTVYSGDYMKDRVHFNRQVSEFSESGFWTSIRWFYDLKEKIREDLMFYIAMLFWSDPGCLPTNRLAIAVDR